MKQWLFFSIMFIFMAGCSNSKKGNSSAKEIAPEKLGLKRDENKQIVFLTFDVALKDSLSDSYFFGLKNKIFAEGTLKGGTFKEDPILERNYFYCQLSNKDGETSNFSKVDDPLNRVYEHPAEGNGNLGKTTISKNKGELTIRFQWQEKWKYLSIYKAVGSPLKLKRIYYAEL